MKGEGEITTAEKTSAATLAAGRELSTAELAYVQRLERGRRLDLDVRGLIALVTLISFFAFVFIQFLLARDVRIPAELATPVAAIVGFYFGSKGGDTNGNGRSS